jgi:hypothetical protein
MIRTILNKMHIKWILLLAPLMLFAAGCIQSNPIVPPLNVNEVQASVSAEGFFSATDALAYDSVNFYYVYATEKLQSGTRSVTLTIPKKTTLPYSVTVGSDPIATISYSLLPGTSDTHYFAEPGIGSGSITVTQISPTLIGSFSGTLWQLPASGTDTIRTISGGEFNAALVN